MKTNYLLVIIPLILLGLTFIYGCSEKGERGIKFSADSQSITFDFSPNFNINNDFSFECNIKLLEEPQKSTMIFGTSRSYAKAYGLYLYDSKIGFGIRSANNRALVQTNEYSLNQWLHLTGTYSGKNKKVSFFIDGTLIGSNILTEEDISLANENLIINGAYSLQGQPESIGFSKFIISNVRLWNITLSESNIINNMDKILNGNEEGLLGYWPMNQTEGETVPDKTSNNHNGTINGGEWFLDKNSK
ncbi:MAG: LamG domain-containing protein [Bacteroidales bacterium]